MATVAKESKQVDKVRKKLEKVLEKEHSHFNKETLNEIRSNIHKWINRHEPERLSPETKTFNLFDENRHPSEIKSRFVLNLLTTIQDEGKAFSKHFPELKGRIKYNPNLKT